MVTAKNVILTAINFKGVAQVRAEAKELSEKLLCSEGYILSVVKKVERSQIEIKGA